MKKILLVLLCLWTFPVAASHIVGGEFEIIHISGIRYRVNLIVYFDELFGADGARDEYVDARIYRKRDNFLMMDLRLPFKGATNVNYTQPECSNGEIKTSRRLYSTEITLTPQQYSDAQGYYLVWERCCRNYGITNIFSENPEIGKYAGQTFYLEFPPVVKKGQTFINSSPRLFPPLNDYACPFQPYYVDFAGIDDDGDSLVYSLVTPLNTITGHALPPGGKPRPGPYPVIEYRPQFNQNNIIDGSPDLNISRDGFLRVTPRWQGLYVFAVRCEEFRDGVKIGEVRRDFQMKVSDKCAAAEPPQILGKKMTDGTFSYDNDMSVTFSDGTSDEDRCIQVRVSDADAMRQVDGYTEIVKIKAVPLNFKHDMSGILPTVTVDTLTNGSMTTFDICFDRCPPLENGTFQVGIVAYDDACSLPLSDTLKVTVTIKPPDNINARFVTADVTDFLVEGVSKTWPIEAVDDDLDSLILGVVPDGFNMADVGMRVEVLEQEDGSYKAQLVWDALCDVYDFSKQTTFKIKVLVEDIDECNYSHPDAMLFTLNVALPENKDPVVTTSLTADELEHGISRKIFESLSFDVFGDDEDNDQVKLSATGKIFNLSTYSMTFPEATGAGHAASQFDWTLLCNKVNVAAKDTFHIQFIAVDNANKCRIYRADTLTVKVKALPPDNKPPLLTIASTDADLPFINHEQTLFVGQQISLGLSSTDGDVAPQDHLVIELIDAEGSVNPTGYIFEPGEGLGAAQTTFTWNTDCSIFENGVFKNDYTFRFRAYDDRCQNTKADTVEVKMTIRDYENNIADFIPPNFVSADHDPELRNEFFAMVRIKDEQTGELESILPLDNCLGHFIGITVYNRWGKPVFESNRRDFRWYPDDDSAGVYFYTLTFSDKEFKGSITVRN